VTLHYNQSGTKSEQVWNSGQFRAPKDLITFSVEAVKIWDCPEKIRMDGHLTLEGQSPRTAASGETSSPSVPAGTEGTKFK